MLIVYDADAKSLRDLFIKELDLKYANFPPTDKQIKKAKLKISRLELRLELKNKQIDAAYIIKQDKTQKSNKKLESLISSIDVKKASLAQKIDLYNDNLVEKFTSDLETYKNQLSTLNQSSSSQKEVSSNSKKNDKKIDKLTNNIINIETTLALIDNKDTQLSISNLKMFFGGIKAINDLSFDVKQGQIFGLIGPNGAGKTTVFNCITQFYKATSGSIVFRNKEGVVVDLNKLQTHDVIKEGIARSFQNVELIWELNVLDNLLAASHSLLVTNLLDHMVHTPRLSREEKVLRLKGLQTLESLGIAEYAYRYPYGLPYGILKKIELARTLMTNPSIIILDEPAAGLNDSETQDLAKMIKRINTDFQVTIFLVEHDMSLVMSICDTICAISFGKMLSIGTPRQIQNDPLVRKAYLGEDDDE
jgi:ABC-type branched-subunit amino acid transport system ATPase component